MKLWNLESHPMYHITDLHHVWSCIQIIKKSIWNFSFMVSQTVYFTGMIVFTLTSQMYHSISVLMPVLVRVPLYLSTSTSTTSTITLELTNREKYEYQKFSTRVLRVRVPSTSTPALPHIELSMGTYLKTGSLPPTVWCHWKLNCQVCHLWLFCWYRSFTMCIRTYIYGSVAFPVLLPIDIENRQNYWNVMYR